MRAGLVQDKPAQAGVGSSRVSGTSRSIGEQFDTTSSSSRHAPLQHGVKSSNDPLGLAFNLSTVAVERDPSDSYYLPLEEWPRLPFTARIERAHSYRARSSSKEGAWALPSHPSQRG